MKDVSTEKWIADNAGCDLATLMLKAAGYPAKQHAAVQHVCRRKAAHKLPTLLSNPDFQFAMPINAEQCTSESLARFHSTLIKPGSCVADLTTGLGVDSIFLSKRASKVISVEIDRHFHDVFVHNIEALGIGNIEAVNDDCMSWLDEAGHFDAMFIDPYRRDSDGSRVFDLESCLPNVPRNLDRLLAKTDRLIIKASPMIDINYSCAQLDGHVERVILVGTPKECKEMVLICTSSFAGKPTIEAVTITGSATASLSWSEDEEAGSELSVSSPCVGDILYEPYPAVMKGGAYKVLCHRFGISAISKNTHLYIGAGYDKNIPAEAFRVDGILEFNKRSCRELSKRYTHLNVATRNFLLKAPELEKRLGVKPGGDSKVYGVTLSDGNRVLLLVSPVTSETTAP